MGQPRAKQVALVVDEHLRFIFQKSERVAMHNAVAVALKMGAVFGRGLVMRAAPCLFGQASKGGKFHSAPYVSHATVRASTSATASGSTGRTTASPISGRKINRNCPPCVFLSTRLTSAQPR